MPRRQPRKPSSPLASIIFPKQGAPSRKVEPLPDSQDDIELVIANKFIAALSQQGRILAPPTRNDVWPDIQSSESGRAVGIEMVEVIYPDHAHKRALQSKYAEQVASLLEDVLPRLAGVHIQLDDGYQDPPYPALNSPVGKRLAAEIAASIRRVVPELEMLTVGSARWYRWREAPGEPQSGAICIRLTQAEVGDRPRISYFGSFPESTAPSMACSPAPSSTRSRSATGNTPGRCGCWRTSRVSTRAWTSPRRSSRRRSGSRKRSAIPSTRSGMRSRSLSKLTRTSSGYCPDPWAGTRRWTTATHQIRRQGVGRKPSVVLERQRRSGKPAVRSA